MNWQVLAGSLAAVISVWAIALWLGMGRGGSIGDREAVFAAARDAHSGFAPIDAAIDRQGRAALVIGEAGDALLLKRHGNQAAARHFRAPPAAEAGGAILRIATGERMYGPVALDLGEQEASRWAARLKRESDA